MSHSAFKWVRTTQNTSRKWLSRIDKDSKEARNKRIFDLWLACHTQQEIADDVGVPQNTLSESFIENGKVANLDKTDQNAANHELDFDVPIYNIWKQQRAERRAGEMLAGMELLSRSHDATQLKDLGINKTQSSRWQMLADIHFFRFFSGASTCSAARSSSERRIQSERFRRDNFAAFSQARFCSGVHRPKKRSDIFSRSSDICALCVHRTDLTTRCTLCNLVHTSAKRRTRSSC